MNEFEISQTEFRMIFVIVKMNRAISQALTDSPMDLGKGDCEVHLDSKTKERKQMLKNR